MELTALDIFWFLVKFVSGLAAFKLYLMLQSLRFYGVYNLYKNRANVFSHPIFSKLDRLYTDQELFNTIPDIARREIFKDVFKSEVVGLIDVILRFRESLYDDYGFFRFMFKHRRLTEISLMETFLRSYNAYRDKLEKQLRHKLLRGGLDSKRAIFVTQKFYEFTNEHSHMIREKIEIIKARKNMYHGIIDLLDDICIIVDAEKKSLPKNFSSLNGRLDGVLYKGYDSFIESNSNIKSLEDNDD